MTAQENTRVLIVDDDQDDIDLLSIYLNKVGNHTYLIDGLLHYDEAMAAILDDRHDIYLIDYRLGADNGIDLVRAVTEQGCHKPVIILTGKGGFDVDVEAMEAGAVDYLVKDGLTAEQLERSIRYSLSQAKAQTALLEARDALEERVAARTVELRRSEAGLRQILDNSPFGVSIVSVVDKKRLYVNQRFVEMCGGTSVAEITATPIEASFVDSKTLEGNWNLFNRVGFIAGSEERRRRLDGSSWWALVDWRPLHFEGTDAVMVWHMDITERKQAEQSLMDSEERQRVILESALDGIIIINGYGKIEHFNPAAERIFGFRCSEVLGKDLANSIIPEESREKHRQGFKQFLATGHHPILQRRLELTAMRADGTRLPVALAITPYKIGGQQFFSGFVRDITKRKKAENKLRIAMESIDRANRTLEEEVRARTKELHYAMEAAERAREEAESASRTKTDFLANMSHELRTPMNAILGFSTMIKEGMLGPIDPVYQGHGEAILTAGEHLMKVISDILDVSRVETGKLNIEKTQMDVAEMLRDCELMLRPRAEPAHIDLCFEASTSLPPLYADPLRVKQVVLNLIENSIKFTPENGRITVRADATEEGAICLQVADTGIGIAEEDIPVALEKFGQVRPGHIHTHEGAGLGLALCKALVELHEGTLGIESEVGKGTTITVMLPPSDGGVSVMQNTVH